MPVVDIRAIELDDSSKLAKQTLPHCLDAKNFYRLHDIVAYAASVIDLSVSAHHLPGNGAS